MLVVDGESLDINSVWQTGAKLVGNFSLAEESKKRILQSRGFIDDRLASGEVMYGVTTGFGAFSDVTITKEQITELQRNLIRSHCVGVGPAFSQEETRAIMLLRANALARGDSGVRVEVVEKILEMLQKDVLAVIPQQGSVGASGDLAPLSHLALSLMGEGKVWSEKAEVVDTASQLRRRGIKPLELAAKEGLSLINGCQVMTAVGLLAAYRARRLIWMMDLAGAMSLEALRGSRSAFDKIIFSRRPHPGEAKTADNLLKLMGESSEISQSHLNCGRVQDAYSLRCMPAVHGAAKDSIGQVIRVLETEANSSTDNPLVFPELQQVLSCGNFHGEPVAFQLDFAAIAMSGIASMSECRIAKLINPVFSQLPAFLAPNGGLNSGHMIVQVAAASLVSENKVLAHPASVDSIPTSADKEDHVSMGTIAARKFKKVVDNATQIVAMEMLSACQALDMLKPLKPASAVAAVLKRIRQDVPFAETDRVFSVDIEKIAQLIDSGELMKVVEEEVGELKW